MMPLYTYTGDGAPDAEEWFPSDEETPTGEPLFHFIGDSDDGPATGDGLGGVWHEYAGPTEPVAAAPDAGEPAADAEAPVEEAPQDASVEDAAPVTETETETVPDEALVDDQVIEAGDVASLGEVLGDATVESVEPEPEPGAPVEDPTEPAGAEEPGDPEPDSEPDTGDAAGSDLEITQFDDDAEPGEGDDAEDEAEDEAEVEEVVLAPWEDTSPTYGGTQVAYDGKRYPIGSVPKLDTREDIVAAIERLNDHPRPHVVLPTIRAAALRIGVIDAIPVALR